MHRSKGFTLIELIVVLVILGILAAVAVPKFLNLKSDSKAAALKGLAGSIKSGVDLVHAKAAAKGEDSQSSVTDSEIVSGFTIKLAFGYPAATDNSQGILVVLDEEFSTANYEAKDAPWYAYAISASKNPSGVNAVYFVHNTAGDIDALKTITKESLNFECLVEYAEPRTALDAATGQVVMLEPPKVTVYADSAACQ